MLPPAGLFPSMNSLWQLSDAQSRSISPENFTGEKGKGGMATDGTGAPLPGTRVVLRSVTTGQETEAQTGADGRYAFPAVVPGSVQVVRFDPSAYNADSGSGLLTEYHSDALGVNDYFGWYPGPNGQIADRDALPDYLESVHACYPDKAIFVSEFGAEANRDGPVEEKGTYTHQQDFVNYHLGVYATKPWLSGALYWTLKEFKIRPEWDGGNPRPNSPIHQKGLITFGQVRKPAFFEVQKAFAATPQVGAARKK